MVTCRCLKFVIIVPNRLNYTNKISMGLLVSNRKWYQTVAESFEIKT